MPAFRTLALSASVIWTWDSVVWQEEQLESVFWGLHLKMFTLRGQGNPSQHGGFINLYRTSPDRFSVHAMHQCGSLSLVVKVMFTSHPIVSVPVQSALMYDCSVYLRTSDSATTGDMRRRMALRGDGIAARRCRASLARPECT